MTQHARPWALETLPWLPAAPNDFRARCDAIDKMVSGRGAALRALGNYYLDLNGLTRVAKSCARAVSDTPDGLKPLTPFRLGLVSDSTTDLIVPCLVASALRYGIALEVVISDFGQATQEALDPQSRINRSKPNAVLIALDHRGLGLQPQLSLGAGAESSDDPAENAIRHIDALRSGFKQACGAPAIIQTVAPPVGSLFGSFDYRIPGSLRYQTESFNRRLAVLLEDGADVLLDVAGLAATVGLDRWHDPIQWHHAKLAFSQSFAPLYAEHVARLIGAMRGKSRKCLVLDLDNTLWGGVIGDDGLEGISLGQGDALGEAFLEVQQMALNLRERGIILAVCSKNDEEVARLPFRQHADMLIKDNHIAVFQANWRDKASNLEAVAEALNIGLDTLVFVDDNPVERAQVREALPDVAVPEMPNDPALYARTVLAAGYFEAIAFTEEDRQRAGQYQAEAQRSKELLNYRDLNEFLQSLAMEAIVAPFDAVGRKRITQLFNKTNQFNLTTRRYTEAEIAQVENDPDVLGLQVRLIDKFGDNGMISTVICRARGNEWVIENWIMSCRVLNRRVEELLCDEIAQHARQRGAEALIGSFIPTARNKMVEDHYAKLGFHPMGEKGGAQLWRLDLHDYTPWHPPITVRAW